MRAATKRAKATSVKAKKPAKKGPPDLKKVYEALCAILKPYEKKLKWKEYGKDFYYLETHDPVYRGKPMCYGGVRLGKNYVSYYLMSVYMAPEMMREFCRASGPTKCTRIINAASAVLAFLRATDFIAMLVSSGLS